MGIGLFIWLERTEAILLRATYPHCIINVAGGNFVLNFRPIKNQGGRCIIYEEISLLTHSSIKISGSKIIYFDTYEMWDDSHDADIIFITHDHFGHFIVFCGIIILAVALLGGNF